VDKRTKNFRIGDSRLVIGSLHDDLQALAGCVQRSMMDGAVTVWAEDDSRVFACPADACPALPVHWIAGTFMFGQSHRDIEEDLRALLRERAKDWIVDSNIFAEHGLGT
jgi:hypothetical protein